MTQSDSTSIPFRSGYVAVVGLPNVGKSTLLNQILKYKISIVSHRPQTTRKSVLGIHHEPGYQIVFLDTPGILDPSSDLQRFMMRQVNAAISDADLLVYLIDASNPRQKIEQIRKQLGDNKKPVILVMNKIDLVPNKKKLLPMIARFDAALTLQAIVPTSAEKDDGVAPLLDEIRQALPAGPAYYPEDFVSDQQERFFVAELVREKVFLRFRDEVPYSTHVEIEEFNEREDGKDYIRAVILIERESQKSIIIGKGGAALKRIGEEAREEIETFLGREVFLELFVKVADDWRKKEAELKRMGYT